jgi:hypothetical protein
VNITQKLLSLATAVGFLSGVAQAQNTLVFEFTANSVGNYRQGQAGTAFNGGTFAFNVRDGQFLYAPAGCYGFLYFPPGPGCPVGATGYVSRGLENDPVLSGRGPYFSVTDIAPALILQPFAPQSVILVSAPPSLLPRPLGGFTDRSLSVFFNLQTPFIRQYPISIYNFERDYTSGERKRFDGEVVTGTYRYNFASLVNPMVPAVLSINQFPTIDGYRKINNQPQGLRFTNVTYDDGFAVLDPFSLSTLTWEGNTPSFIAPGLDLAYFSIKPLSDPADPLSDPVEYDGRGPFIESPPGSFFLIPNPTVPLFPNFTGPTVTRVLLPNALDKSYTLAPNFLTPGTTGVIDLEFEIFRPTTNVIFDNSIRRFRLPVKVLNTLAGFISSALPANATALQRSGDFDYDGDGVSNFTEWVFGSDPSKASSVPKSPGVNTVAAAPSSGSPLAYSTFAPAGDTSSQGVLEYKVAKLNNAVPKLNYFIEYSADMKTWTTITTSNPEWNLVDTANEIKATSEVASKGGFFRTKVQAAN